MGRALDGGWEEAAGSGEKVAVEVMVAVFLLSAASKSSSISAEEDFLRVLSMDVPSLGIVSSPFPLTVTLFMPLVTDLLAFLVGNLLVSLEDFPLVILLIRPRVDQSALSMGVACVPLPFSPLPLPLSLPFPPALAPIKSAAGQPIPWARATNGMGALKGSLLVRGHALGDWTRPG